MYMRTLKRNEADSNQEPGIHQIQCKFTYTLRVSLDRWSVGTVIYDVDFLPKVAPKSGYLWICTPELELVQKTSE